MKRPSGRTFILGLLATGTASAVAGLILGSSLGTSGSAPAATATPAAARTSFPGLAAASGEPELASIRAASPSSGQILQASGPFDDRFVLDQLSFDGSAVSGALRITSDVSDVLELQVLAGFFDQKGTFLGTGRFVHHLGADGHSHKGEPQLRKTFTIQVPTTFADRAVSVAIGVPVLVNE